MGRAKPRAPGHSWDMESRSTKAGETTDELGRRRFHGAFTGGFSAGYFNSVGSKEGWTPQQFSSSRSKRAEYKPQTLSDFQDAEDQEAEASHANAAAAELAKVAQTLGPPSLHTTGLVRRLRPCLTAHIITRLWFCARRQ